MYGDSLTLQAQPYLATHGTVGVRFAGGDAPCTALSGLDSDPGAYAPQVVELQYLGNLPGCMDGRDPQSGYEQDLATLASFWKNRGVTVVMVLSPKLPFDNFAWARQAEQNVAANLGLPINNAGAAVELPGEVWTAYLSCLPDEGPANGCGYEVPTQIRVREPTWGEHFGTSNAGGSYSSGARRFGDAEAAS
jgi:hypothetical protein